MSKRSNHELITTFTIDADRQDQKPGRRIIDNGKIFVLNDKYCNSLSIMISNTTVNCHGNTFYLQKPLTLLWNDFGPFVCGLALIRQQICFVATQQHNLAL